MMKLKPGDEGYLNEADRTRYLVYACALSVLIAGIIAVYFIIKIMS